MSMIAVRLKRPWGLVNAGEVAGYTKEQLAKMPEGTYELLVTEDEPKPKAKAAKRKAKK